MSIDEIITDPSLKLALETSNQTREQAIALLDFVSTASTTSPPSNDVLLQISKQQKLLLTYLAQLRGLHRDSHAGARETKALTAEARQEVDRLHLQLQNLYYEQRHLQGEIAACESYDHKYQQLPLIPVDEFLAQHPEHADTDENALMIARIDHEHQERLKLEEQRQGLLKKKQGLIADNKKRKDDLANLDKDLEKFIDAAKPIQKTFERVPPKFQVVVNDSNPIFFYCSAPGACHEDVMIGVVNANSTQTFTNQLAYAENSSIQFSPGENFPVEASSSSSSTIRPTSITSPTQSPRITTSGNQHRFHSGIPTSGPQELATHQDQESIRERTQNRYDDSEIDRTLADRGRGKPSFGKRASQDDKFKGGFFLFFSKSVFGNTAMAEAGCIGLEMRVG
ncbi:hypothetical protein DID88_004242 [Monilinia fructigena]|uniref:Uncharacterized protein n=1 Tax=Monilinia fructigena TaxID=38457 RepID=A0A395ISA8_9HELO|nr:hypothetical protein DID88_004242 [Monilinia fructigena]